MYRFGSFEVDFSTSQLRRNGSVVRVQEQPLRILEALLECPGELVTRERLKERLWPSDTFVDFERSLNAGVAKLRQALHDSAEEPIYIETLARKGYRFIAPVTRPVAVEPQVASQPPVSALHKYPQVFGAAMVVAVCACALLAWTLSRQNKVAGDNTGDNTGDNIGPIRFTVLLPEGSRIAGEPVLPSMAMSPDGRNLAMVLSQADDTQSIWLRPISSEVAHRLDGTDGASLPFWSPDGKEIGYFSENQLKRITIAGGQARVLCRSISSPGGASWGRAGVIVYSADNILHAVDTSGGPCQPITRLETSESRHAWPHFLTDGRRFLYLAAVRDAERNTTFLASLDNHQRHAVLVNGTRASFAPADNLLFVREGTLFAQKWDFDANRALGSAYAVAGADIPFASNVNPLWIGAAPFTVSDNGVLVYRTRAEQWRQIVSYSREGKRLKTIAEPGKYAQISLSPDEKTFAIFVAMVPQVLAWRIWLLRHDTGVISRPDFGHVVNSDPVWSPDSRRIVFSMFDAEDGKSDLFEWTVGEHQPKLLFSDGKQNKPDDWSNDGRILVYRRDNKLVRALAMEDGGGKPVPTGDIEFRKDQSQLSPDGRMIAYNSDHTGGRQEVYVGPFPSFRGMIQVSSQGGVQPVWGSDGKELFYLAPDKNLMSVQIRNGSTIEATTPKPLFQTSLAVVPWGSHYVVSKDGQKIYALEPVASRQDTLHVFTHWNAAP
jgi:DNA-binding winged helix-turn-helix (wHTH) protein/Tol biopolymer transport system component